MLELSKIIEQVDAMSQELVQRQALYRRLLDNARQALIDFDHVDDTLRKKIDRAQEVDPTWRGAYPCDLSLNARFIPPPTKENASLIAVDGSQIYPNRHGPALYYLINTGVIILRQGTGEAPVVDTHPQVFYSENDLYDNNLNLLNTQMVNSARELEEMRQLAYSAEQERQHFGGDLDHLIVAMTDGPLLIWISEEERSAAGEKAAQERVRAYLQQLQRIKQSQAIPIGYVARPRSANVLRLLHVAQLEIEDITKESVRASRYRALTDATLFSNLAPNQRTALFKSTARVNKRFADDGHEICFFYINVSRHKGAPHIARVDIPKWAAEQPQMLDRVHSAIYGDCDGTDYPYTLIRAHELALVTHQERQELENMLAIAYMRLTGDNLSASVKEELKRNF